MANAQKITLKNFEKTISSLYSNHNRFEVLKDFFKLTAISIRNGSTLVRDETWKKYETEYIETMKRYEKSEQQTIFKAFAELVEVINNDVEQDIFKDWLGQFYMESGTSSSKDNAQFFTPYSVAKLMADMQLSDDKINELKSKEYITMYEPCVGGGCISIAACASLKAKNINYQKKLIISCEDNDERCFYMTYIQLSLIGAMAVVEYKDSLLNKNLGKKWLTPTLKWNPASLKLNLIEC